MKSKKHNFIKTNRLNIFEKLGGLDWTAIGAELDRWKNGTNGYLICTKIGRPKSREQLAYYYAVILPEAFEVFKESGEVDVIIHVKNKQIRLPLSIDSVDWFLKANYALYHGEYKDKADMTKAECSDFENWAIIWLAKWFDCQVPPADPEWRKKGF